MDYNKLKRFAQVKGIQLNSLAFATEMTLTGFKISFENGTFPIKKVDVLCKMLDITPNELFNFVPSSDNAINISQNGGIGNQQTNNTTSIVLEKQLEEKDKQISELHEKIDMLLEIIKDK